MWQRDTLMQLKPGCYNFLGLCGFLVMPSEAGNQQQNLPVMYYWMRSDNGQKRLSTAEEFMGHLLDVCVLCAKTWMGTEDFTFTVMDASDCMKLLIQLKDSHTSHTTT